MNERKNIEGKKMQVKGLREGGREGEKERKKERDPERNKPNIQFSSILVPGVHPRQPPQRLVPQLQSRAS